MTAYKRLGILHRWCAVLAASAMVSVGCSASNPSANTSSPATPTAQGPSPGNASSQSCSSASTGKTVTIGGGSKYLLALCSGPQASLSVPANCNCSVGELLPPGHTWAFVIVSVSNRTGVPESLTALAFPANGEGSFGLMLPETDWPQFYGQSFQPGYNVPPAAYCDPSSAYTNTPDPSAYCVANITRLTSTDACSQEAFIFQGSCPDLAPGARAMIWLIAQIPSTAPVGDIRPVFIDFNRNALVRIT